MSRVPRKNRPQLPKGQKSPARKLKELRERAGVTALKAAEAYNRAEGKDPRKASPNTWYRWEDEARVGHTPIADHVIAAVMPLIVGQGSPPVTAEELLALSSGYELLKVTGRTQNTGASTGANRITPQDVVAPVFRDENTAEPLIVRCRAERGVYMEKNAFRKRTFGVAPITAANDIRAEQFCVLVADGHADKWYGPGAVAHCVSPSAYSPAQMKGKRVAVIQEAQGGGLVEVGIGEVTGVAGNSLNIVDAHGKKMTGEVYGVIIGSYARE